MWREWIDDILDLFYPNRCVACGRELAKGEASVCTFCRWDLPVTDYWLRKDNYVEQLLAGRFPFENACSFLFYSGGRNHYRRMIHRMKYSSRTDVALTLGESFGRELASAPDYADVDLLVPVPLHWTKLIKRGFNQSELLCRGMARQMEIEVDTRSVRRSRRTRQQAKLNKDRRWDNVAQAFGVAHPQKLKGKHILLVDDVMTTGSTIEACAEAIAREVEDVRISIATLAVVYRSAKGGVADKLSEHDSRELDSSSED